MFNWSGLPVVHIRPTTFLGNPMFTSLAVPSLREHNELVLPFGSGRTSPITASDVARTVAAVLMDPAERIGNIYELTGPASLDIEGLAAEYSRGLGRPIHGTDIAHDRWLQDTLKPLALLPHVEQHIATMALLHRAGRYDRATHDVEKITGQRPCTVGSYVARHGAVLTRKLK